MRRRRISDHLFATGYIMRKYAIACASLILGAALSACHGNNGSASTTTTTSAVSNAGKTFYGTVNFGDTIKLVLDSPSAGQMSISFPNSQYGITQTFVEPYTWTPATAGATTAVANDATSGGTSSAGAAGSTPGVAGLSVGTLASVGAGVAAAAGIQAAVAASESGTAATSTTAPSTTSTSTATGTVEVSTGSGVLTGTFIASNQASISGAAAPSVGSLAGTYAFIRDVFNVTSGSATSTAISQSGNLNIASDGTVTICPYANYTSSCTGALTGMMTASAAPVIPGAFDFKLGGMLIGQANAFQQPDGTYAILIDQVTSDSGGAGETGAWTIAPAKTIGFTALDGTWNCTKSPLGSDAATSFTATFSDESSYSATDGSTGTFTVNYTLEPPQSSSSQLPTFVAATGLANEQGEIASSATAVSQVFLPIGTNTLVFLDSLTTPSAVRAGACTLGS